MIGYRPDIVLFYLSISEVGSIVFYHLKSKKVLKSLQVPFFSRNKATSLQLLSGTSGRDEVLMLSYEDGSDVFIDLDRERVIARFDGEVARRVVEQVWVDVRGA